MYKFKLLLIPLLLLSNGLSAEETAAELQSRVSKLERMVDNRGLLNILDEIQSLQKEVRELRGEVEQQAYTIEQMKKRNMSLYDDLEQRIQGGATSVRTDESVQVIDNNATVEYQTTDREQSEAAVVERSLERQEVQVVSNKTPSGSTSSIKPVETYVAKTKPQATTSTREPVQPAPQQTASTSSGMSDEESYSEAFNLLKLGKHDLSVSKFRSFLVNHPSSQYADNAQYWLGEAFYAKRDFAAAVREYKLLLSEYPDSGKTSHAQLKLGYSYNEMGENDFAQGELEDLISRYPGTSAANLAKERLDHIRAY